MDPETIFPDLVPDSVRAGWPAGGGGGSKRDALESVLGEACWHLGGNTQPVHALLGLVRMGAIQILHPWPGHLERTQELMMKYSRMDAAGASLVMLSEIHRNAKIITTDRRDFSIYRRFGRQRLPVIFPPA
jgi:hypothetical protein